MGATNSLLQGQPREGCEPLRPCPDRTSFFTFHSSFSLTASSALPMVRQVAGRRHQAAPRAPVRPHRLRASRLSAPHARRSPRPLHSPPAAAAATARCSAPQPSSEPRRRQAAGPAPSHSRQGGGVCAATGEGGSGRVRTPGGVGPGRAPQGWLSWRPARSRPEGANPHCERWESASRHCTSGQTLKRYLLLA